MGAQPSSVTPLSNVDRSSMSDKEKQLVKSGDPIIVVFGQSGAGKSSFINLIAQDKQAIGRTVESCTEQVKFIEATIHGRRIVIVDTPGMDDTREGIQEADVLETIAHSLEVTGRDKIWVTGILYLHRISETRFSPAAKRVSAVLEKLCGKPALKRITFCTTMWSDPPVEDETVRHGQICNTNNLKEMISGGAQVTKHSNRWQNAQENAENILNDLIQRVDPGQLAMQRQIIGDRKTVPQTDAGKVLTPHVEKGCIIC